MKKINLGSIFESLIQGKKEEADNLFHKYTIAEGAKINAQILSEDESVEDELKNETSITIDLTESEANPDELNSLFDEIMEEFGIEADVVYDEEEKKYTLTFDSEEEADTFTDELSDRVTARDIDQVEVCGDEEDEEELEENSHDEWLEEPYYRAGDRETEVEGVLEDGVSNFHAPDFLSEYSHDLGLDNIGDANAEPEDYTVSKQEIMDALNHYFAVQVSDALDIELDEDATNSAAEAVYDKAVAGIKELGGIVSDNSVDEGKDLGKPGKNFAKIAKSAGKEYGSKEAGERVAGSVLKNLRKEHPRKYAESTVTEDEIGNNESPIDAARRMGYDAAKDGNENKFNSELRALMNDKAGDAQREDIHKAYIEGMDDYHNESKVTEGVFDPDNVGTIILKLEDNIDDTLAERIFNKIYDFMYTPEWAGEWDSEIHFKVPSDADYNYDLRAFEKIKGVKSVEFIEDESKVDESEDEELTVDTDVDTVEDESEDDKLDLILAKISELESQLAGLDDTDTVSDDTVSDEDELPEDGEDYDDLSEDYRLEPVKTEANVDGELVGSDGKKNKQQEESPMSKVEGIDLAIKHDGIQSPSKDNAKGYEWKDIPKVDKSKLKGDVKNAEQKLEKVNKDDKKALVNKSQGKGNDESVLGNGTIAESSKRVLRTRR